MKKDVIKYKNGALVLDVQVSPEEDTVWLTQDQMSKLFGVNSQAISKHISNIYKQEELIQNSTCSILEQVQKEGKRTIKRTVKIYNLDMIISVGYRVNSKQGIAFRRWATSYSIFS